MKLGGMKALDRWAGAALCGLAAAGAKFRPFPPPPVRVAGRVPPESLRKILVIKFWGMGGLTLTLPVFRALRRAYPDAELHLATLTGNRELADWLGLADQLHLLELRGSTLRTAGAILRFFSEVRSVSADAALDLEYLTRFSALVAAASRAPLRLGFASPAVYRGRLHNLALPYRADLHVTENFLQFAQALDPAVPAAPDFSPRPAETERRAAEAFLAGRGVKPEKDLIVVNPNAGALALERRWPAEYFAALLDRLAEAGRGTPVLIGAPEEAEFVAGLHGRLRNPGAVLNLAGRLSFAQLIGLLDRARLLVSNDSGPLHLAALLGTPTVSFFGPETPKLYAPRGPGHAALYAGMDCSPCLRVETAKTARCIYPRPECLLALTPDRAWVAVEKALAH